MAKKENTTSIGFEDAIWSTAYVSHVVFNEKFHSRNKMQMIDDAGITIDKDKFTFKLLP